MKRKTTDEMDLADNLTWEDDDEVVELDVKKPLDKVIPVRLTDESWRSLRREATRRGIGPTTLARMWLLERLETNSSKRRTA